MTDHSTTMNDIDFLPAELRAEGVKRRTSLWRLAVVAMIGGAMAVAALYQHVLYKQAQTNLAAVETQHAAAELQTKRLADLQAQVLEARATAELLTYLRHPWPKTQILRSLLAPLPEGIHLSELHIFRENAKSAAAGGDAAGAKKDAPPDKSPLAAQDLKALKNESERARLIVSIDGTTNDVAALHEYLAQLARDPLFTKVDLRTITSVQGAQDAAAQFSVTLAVRPGYGQPGGPDASPVTKVAVAATAAAIGRIATGASP